MNYEVQKMIDQAERNVASMDKADGFNDRSISTIL